MWLHSPLGGPDPNRGYSAAAKCNPSLTNGWVSRGGGGFADDGECSPKARLHSYAGMGHRGTKCERTHMINSDRIKSGNLPEADEAGWINETCIHHCDERLTTSEASRVLMILHELDCGGNRLRFEILHHTTVNLPLSAPYLRSWHRMQQRILHSSSRRTRAHTRRVETRKLAMRIWGPLELGNFELWKDMN